jgi:hypothetical protein
MGMVGWFVVALLFSITLMLPSLAQMLGVAAAQLWLGQACPTASWPPAMNINTNINTANMEETTCESNFRFPFIVLLPSPTKIFISAQLAFPTA